MNIKHTLSCLSLAVLLAACGGGGGGSTPTTTPVNNAGGNTQQPGQPTQPAQSGITVLGAGKAAYTGQAAVFNDAANIRKITVGGKTVDLVPAGTTFNNNWNIKGHGFVSGGNRFWDGVDSGIVSRNGQNVVAGFVRVNGQATAFYNGNLSSNVPSSGVVNYQTSLVTTNVNSESVSSGSGVLAADFGSKQLTGSLGSQNINANISGSTFQSAAGAATEIRGGFFGNNAAEIGGVVKNGDNIGAFVGTRQ